MQLNSVAVTDHLRERRCLKLFSSPFIFRKIFQRFLNDNLKSDLIWLENSINFPEMFEEL